MTVVVATSRSELFVSTSGRASFPAGRMLRPILTDISVRMST